MDITNNMDKKHYGKVAKTGDCKTSDKNLIDAKKMRINKEKEESIALEIKDSKE